MVKEDRLAQAHFMIMSEVMRVGRLASDKVVKRRTVEKIAFTTDGVRSHIIVPALCPLDPD